jgi:hypothetical protein
MTLSAAPTVAASPAEAVPAPVRMLEIVGAYQVGQAAYVAAKLGIADLIAAGTTSTGALAEATGAVPQRLHRLLRSLAGFGIFRQSVPGEWALTPLAETLLEGAPGSVRDMAITWNEEHFRAYADLLGAVTTGRPAFEIHYGTDWWSYLRDHPEAAETFNAAMGNMSRQVQAAAAAAYDFGQARHLVDVGAGHGTFVAILLEQNPALTATVFDLPHVIEGAQATFTTPDRSNRVELVGGDFFAAVPPGGDAYVLSFILHDWSDSECITILENVRRAIPDDGRLVVIEHVLPETDEPHFGKLIDLTMLGLLTGQERTDAEFARIFAAAGFRLERVVPTASSTSVIEALPI